LHGSERAHADAKRDGKEERDLLSVIEGALEEERTRLMLANSVLGCVQIALDPEAISVAQAVYFPEVLESVRQLINTSVRRLEYEEIRRLSTVSIVRPSPAASRSWFGLPNGPWR
jgi:hypothetical protein